jgi:hypothetical protein
MVMNIVKKLGISVGIMLGGFVIFFLGSVAFLSLIRVNDLSLQRKHMLNLIELYAEDYVPINESQFSNFDLSDQTIRLNEIQVLATHNSYKKIGSGLGKFFIGLGDSFDEANALKYGYDSLTDQFNVGVRSIELDVRYRKGTFEVTHVPLVDNSSTTPNLALAIEEIKLWSDNNPNHIPISVLVEIKHDWMMLDLELKEITEVELLLLDQLISNTLGTKLLSPKDVIGSSSTLKAAITENGWPLLKNTLGKVIFILHPGRYTDTYVEMDSDFNSMAMFPAASNSEIDNTYTSFIVHNDPNVEIIKGLVSQNFIVRTGLDGRLTPDAEQFNNAIASGAQILTSDFPPNHNFKGIEYVAYLKEQYTIIKNTYITG